MRNFLLTSIGIFILIFSPLITNAQDDSLLIKILDQLDSTQRTAYFNNTLDNSNLEGLGDGLDNSGVLDSLSKLIAGDNPIGPDLDDLSGEWSGGGMFLSDLIDSTNMDTFNISGLLGEYDTINAQWNLNRDSLGNIFDLYQDELGEIQGDNTDDPPGEAFDSLTQIFENPDTSSLGGLGGERFNGIIKQLFGRGLFSDLELAYGRKSAGVLFYNLNNPDRGEIQVMRVGSVPNFRSLWESRWHASASFTNSIVTTSPDGTITTTAGFNPFVMDFDYAVMYNPGRSGDFLGINYEFRTIFGLGIEAAMYAPAHADLPGPSARNRIGNTTGYGPQFSSGFSTRFNNYTTYAIASAAYGDVVCRNTLDHNYSSLKFEAGVRYSDIVNIRYSIGEQSWTADLSDDTGKRVSTRQQFTVGLILDSLFKQD